jgi:YVTN family beta-propeller protein
LRSQRPPPRPCEITAVINPKTNQVLGTIPLGRDRLDQVLGPIDTGQINVHGLGFSRDGSKLDVIDTATDSVITTLHVGQDPMALVYVAGAVPHGSGTRGLTRQGLGKRIQTMPAQVRGSAGTATVTIRATDGIDELDVAARGLTPRTTFIAYGVRPDGTSSP